jgi:acyl carrier protein
VIGRTFARQLTDCGYVPSDLPDSLDLLSGGIIDSMGILELIGAVEEAFGKPVDYEGLAVERLTVVGDFSRYVASQLA